MPNNNNKLLISAFCCQKTTGVRLHYHKVKDLSIKRGYASIFQLMIRLSVLLQRKKCLRGQLQFANVLAIHHILYTTNSCFITLKSEYGTSVQHAVQMSINTKNDIDISL